MDTPRSEPAMEAEKKAFKRFVAKRMVLGILATVAALWVIGTVMAYFSDLKSTEKTPVSHTAPASSETHDSLIPQKDETAPAVSSEKEEKEPVHPTAPVGETPHVVSGAKDTPTQAPAPAAEKTIQKPAAESAETGHAAPESHDAEPHPRVQFPVRGMAFVDALIQPLNHELNERFWGWRPNDLIQFTDNVNQFQLGALEVTRRSAVILTERISRTGSTEAFDRNLENAMNWFMIKADKYWFPSAESKYRDGLKELKNYFNKLEKRQAAFYTRADNLIPLLSVYEDLLGSCDENLVKQKEKDGTSVSFFAADDYFYYAKGVASAMLTLMEAVAVDFDVLVESRRGTDDLHHAIHSLELATQLDPWIIFNSDLSGFFANHRANMAAPISHARFYVGVLIKALST